MTRIGGSGDGPRHRHALAERKSRHAALYAALLANDISKWGDRFLSILMGTKNFDLTATETKLWQSPAGPPH